MSIKYYYQTDVVRLIRNYLKEHPQSEDTINGIVQWWIKQQMFADSVVAVDNALKILEKQNEVCSIKRNDEIYYRLTKSK